MESDCEHQWSAWVMYICVQDEDKEIRFLWRRCDLCDKLEKKVEEE